MKVLKEIWKLLVEIAKLIAFFIPTACMIMSLIYLNKGDELKSIWYLAMSLCWMVSDIRHRLYKIKRKKIKVKE